MKNDPRFADNPLYQIRRLEYDGALEPETYAFLLTRRDEQCGEFLSERAEKLRRRHFGRKPELRASLEVSNECGRACGFCGRCAGNSALARFRLTPEEAVGRLRQAWDAGARSFALRAGEGYPDTAAFKTVEAVKKAYPKCSVTCDMCGRGADFFAGIKRAGADACFLPFYAASQSRFGKLAESAMTLAERRGSIESARSAGLLVGTGFFAGAPGTAPRELAEDIAYLAELRPDYICAPPFIPEKGSAAARKTAAKPDVALFVTGLLRLAFPKTPIECPAGLDSLLDGGRELGLLFGATVVTADAAEDIGALRERLDRAV